MTNPFPELNQLVPMAHARVVLGQNTEEIMAALDCGKLRFAFNVSAKGRQARILEIRLWSLELVKPTLTAGLSVPQAIAKILGPHQKAWKGVELAQMLLVSRPSIHRLYQSKALPGQVRGNTLWVGRPALEEFLTTRLLNAPS